MSAVTKRSLDGKGKSFSIRLIKCFVFFMCDGILLVKSWMKWVI